MEVSGILYKIWMTVPLTPWEAVCLLNQQSSNESIEPSWSRPTECLRRNSGTSAMKTTPPRDWTTPAMFEVQSLTPSISLGCLPFSTSMAQPASCRRELNPLLTYLFSSFLLLSNSADLEPSQVLQGQSPDSSSWPPIGLFPRQT